jgi:hypothetical protein
MLELMILAENMVVQVDCAAIFFCSGEMPYLFALFMCISAKKKMSLRVVWHKTWKYCIPYNSIERIKHEFEGRKFMAP